MTTEWHTGFDLHLIWNICYEMFDNSCSIACVSNVLKSIDPRVSITTPVT